MSCKLQEKNQQSEIIQDGLKVLNKKNLGLIIHGNSFPSIEDENVGFGTYNSAAGRKLIDFCSGIFNIIQLGPAGKTKSCDSSPYTSTIFSNNPLFVDLKELTTKQWHSILSTETFNEIVANNPNKDIAKTSYSYVYKAFETALNEAYENFKNIDDKKLIQEFENYKNANKFWLEKDSLYEALTIEHNNDYWPLWESETDKNIFNPTSIEQKLEFGNRINELEAKYQDEINEYSFIQFIAYKQIEKTKKYAQEKGIKMVADRQVAFSDRDCWAYQSLFLDGWLLGCPPDYFSANGQAWGFPVIDPDKLFKSNGELEEGGILLKSLFKKMFKDNPGGVRIDHIVGLIDPWVYKKGKKPTLEDGAGRLYSSPEHPELLKYAIPSLDDLNYDVTADKEKRVKSLSDEQILQYGRLIEKIVIEAAKEEGLDKDSIICEDLGTLTNPVAAVMEKFELQGMKLTQFVVPEMPEHPYRGKNINAKTWAMVGTHDNQPIIMWAENLINTHEGYLHAKNLVEDLYKDAENKDDLIVKMNSDADFLALNKIIEIFASKAENIQIFFPDVFGIKDIYNRPGTSGDENWSLRLPNNFEKFYQQKLIEDKAINFAKLIRLAIEARGKEFAAEHKELLLKLRELE